MFKFDVYLNVTLNPAFQVVRIKLISIIIRVYPLLYIVPCTLHQCQDLLILYHCNITKFISFTPEFLKRTLSSLSLDTSTVANRSFSQKSMSRLIWTFTVWKLVFLVYGDERVYADITCLFIIETTFFWFQHFQPCRPKKYLCKQRRFRWDCSYWPVSSGSTQFAILCLVFDLHPHLQR